MIHGQIPPKDACWECFQPIVFYYPSFVIAKTLLYAGVEVRSLPKLLQLLPCIYAIVTLLIIYLILRKLPLSDFAKTLAFATVCFLPRHIYMSAMHTNDSMAYMTIAICIYLIIILLEKNVSYAYQALLCILTIGCIFTKYTNFIILPALGFVSIMLLTYYRVASYKKISISILLTVIIPLFVLSFYASNNIKSYGKAFPINTDIYAKIAQPPGKGKISFFDFAPWKTIRTPILSPDNIGSFWTAIHSRMWFDFEPKFVHYLDSDKVWWLIYFQYLKGENIRPPTIKLPKSIKYTGSSLILLGIFPTLISLIGVIFFLLGKTDFTKNNGKRFTVYVYMLMLILFCNIGGIIMHTIKNPYYSSMKATFLLNSLPCFAVLLALGVNCFENIKLTKFVLTILFSLIYVVTAIHICHLTFGILS